MRRASRGPRGTEYKTGQHTRARLRAELLRIWGPYCWICVLSGKGLRRSRINLRLKWPHPRCFTRDHVIPRAMGGSEDITNQRPAHHMCNSSRGARALIREG